MKECVTLFERYTDKWYRLQESLYGLRGTAKSLKIMLETFDRYYPRVRPGSVTFGDVIKTITESNSDLTIQEVAKKLRRSKTVTYEFLSALDRWGILQTYKVGTRKMIKNTVKLRIPRRDDKWQKW